MVSGARISANSEVPSSFLLTVFVTAAFLLVPGLVDAEQGSPVKTQTGLTRIPVIDVTDLYHPYQDVGDNFDLVAAYALPEIDLRAVILDAHDSFRKAVSDFQLPTTLAA